VPKGSKQNNLGRSFSYKDGNRFFFLDILLAQLSHRMFILDVCKRRATSQKEQLLEMS